MTAESSHHGGVTVLIVEDSAPVRARVVALLQEYGLEVVGEAATAAEALALAESLRPDAIVLDLHLPDGDGIDLLPALKAREPAPLVAVLTNSTQVECRNRCLALGADHFFDKSREFEAVADALFRHAA
jgi:two-component system, OmpR family, response regulator